MSEEKNRLTESILHAAVEFQILHAGEADVREIQAKYGLLAPRLLSAFAVIGSTPGITMSQAAARLRMRKQQMTPLAAQLVEKGYVERRRQEPERREIHLYLTSQGETVLQELFSIPRTWLENALDVTDSAHWDDIASAFEIVSAFLRGLHTAR